MLLGERPLPAPLERINGALAPALLAALVVVQTLGEKSSLVIDARLAGVAAAAIALLLRAPLMVVLLTAAVVAAAVHALS